MRCCGLTVPKSLTDRKGRCPRCARLYQCARHARNDRAYRCARREKSRQEALPLISVGRRLRRVKVVVSASSATQGQGKAQRRSISRKRT